MTRLRSICVYCGASNRVSERFKAVAADLGTQLAARGLDTVYGGGRVGLMGIVADAALKAGGRVIGFIPEHLKNLEVEHLGITEMHVVTSMHERKMGMFDRADAIVVLPGGLGTLDETFEILTWKQLRLHDKPLVIVNIDGYWDPLFALLDHMISAGFCRPEHRDLMRVVADLDGLFPALEAEPEPTIDPRLKWT